MTFYTDGTGRVFDEAFYKSISLRASEYAREILPNGIVPVNLLTDKLDAKEWKKPIMGASTGVRGETEYSAADKKMETPLTSKTFKLEAVRADLYYDANDLALDRNLLVQKQNEQLMEWARQAMVSLWKGVYTGGFSAAAGATPSGSKINDGFLAQATTVEDLDGTNSALTTAGDVYKALQKMLTSMPARYMQRGNLTLGMTQGFAIKARGVTYMGSEFLMGEMDKFLQQYGPSSPTPIIRNIVVSDDLFLDTSTTGGDVVGTNDRLVLYANDPNVLESVYSRGFSMLGEVPNLIGGYTQAWATRSEGCVYQPTAVLYSEQIAWA